MPELNFPTDRVNKVLKTLFTYYLISMEVFQWQLSNVAAVAFFFNEPSKLALLWLMESKRGIQK